MKKLVAYSSVSHLGFVMLGIASLNTPGMEGAVYQMLNHGVSTGALFLLVGVIYERRHTRLISEYGGLWKQLPVYAVCFLVIMLSSIGLPGLNGFIGEFLVLLGSFGAHPWATGIATTGVIFAAAYLLWAIQRIIFNRLGNEENASLKDLTGRELAVLLPLVAVIIWMGLAPGPVLRRMEPAAAQYVELARPASGGFAASPSTGGVRP
jgi:NADH-quinone oxidoreductase subunit M